MTDTSGTLITVPSMNKKAKAKGLTYIVDRGKLTCTCPAFTYGMTRPCKHMKATLTAAELDKAKAAGKTDNLHFAKAKENGVGGLYTIGHSNYTVEYFIKLLKEYDITTLVDVRTKPFSRFNPQFSRGDLSTALHKAGIRYFFGGKTLGGIGKSMLSVKDKEFKADMGKVLDMAKTENVTLMCSERNPNECHRAMKLTAYVNREYPDVWPQHITKLGLIDAKAMEKKMPKSWYWKEFGGQYGK